MTSTTSLLTLTRSAASDGLIAPWVYQAAVDTLAGSVAIGEARLSGRAYRGDVGRSRVPWVHGAAGQPDVAYRVGGVWAGLVGFGLDFHLSHKTPHPLHHITTTTFDNWDKHPQPHTEITQATTHITRIWLTYQHDPQWVLSELLKNPDPSHQWVTPYLLATSHTTWDDFAEAAQALPAAFRPEALWLWGALHAPAAEGTPEETALANRIDALREEHISSRLATPTAF